MIFYYQIFALLILNCLVIVGFNQATHFEYIDSEYPEHGIVEGSKMIGWKFRRWCLETLGDFWSKPICTCITCMASLHSAYPYLFFLWMNHFDNKLIWFYPIYILALAGFNHSYSKIILKD